MTTVACNGREIAADSKCTSDDGSFSFLSNKLYRIGDAIYGEAGGSGSSKVIKWISRGMSPTDEPSFDQKEGEEFIVMELHQGGIALWDKALFRFPLKDKFMAIGSGRDVAMYAMKYLGLSPLQAVVAASKIDENTAGPFYSRDLSGALTTWKPERRPKTKVKNA